MDLNGVAQIEKAINKSQHGMKTHEIIAFSLGVALFVISIYAFNLNIKANKLQIKKLKDEGYT